MPSWIPVPGTTSGRLVSAALDLFGAEGYAPVGVGAIAARAEVTTGSLYHHFGSKAGLYRLVRADVEQRVLDRLEGAASSRGVAAVADLAPVLLVGFDYLVRSGSARLLGEGSPDIEGDAQPDPIETMLNRLIGNDGAAIGALVAAAWRAALLRASEGPEAAADARSSLERLLTGA